MEWTKAVARWNSRLSGAGMKKLNGMWFRVSKKF